VPAKAKYGPFDMQRAVQYFGTVPLVSPPFFPILSVVPQRAMLVVKDRHPQEVFEKCFLDTWIYSFVKHIDISKLDGLAKLLSGHFDEKEVKEIMTLMTTKEYKDKLTGNTKTALEQGAFGAPWFWMMNSQGKQEPLFGSDRWAYMFRFMGVEFEDLKIIDKSKSKL
jgi:glutathione S-transferase kappa 1